MRSPPFFSCFLGALYVPALAYGHDLFINTAGGAVTPRESPQNFAFEMRASLYQPDIDTEPSLGGRRPYEDMFGSTPRFLLGMEFDWQALRIPYIGTLGPGIEIACTVFEAESFQGGAGTRSGDNNSLWVIPGYLDAVFRVDVFPRNLGVPFVPYAKGGFGWGIWWVTNEYGIAEYKNGQRVEKGQGYSLGFHVAAGLTFQLDILDPSAARSLDEWTGINHIYLFGEFTKSVLNGLGEGDSLRLGSNMWTAGLTFEF
ncbi:MXAN_2562 family outer membrane beta-barrel protein [Pajaroellobacter abortibovis]|uniref:Outer membrane protein beta-barrel domain-containing protein n=1 Tax=Pajaroellobacter abortibovis TaxID=1882918 RepID=A0A1L6MYG6_9BACT|nr:MXAN_2562 family outer membrane beta-barrel protein [Pajaroellobacter abortibovis]APS00594.1 hypothetical protein BCY86_07850 [Pajaroellobacter abortibovis]